MPSSQPVRWGIIGPGNIAHRFAEGVGAVADAELVAVASRDPQRATAFGRKWGVPRCYDGYQALLADNDVDAVYVATGHPQHRPCVLLAIEAGKAVLCEKPFAVNAAEAAEMVAAARARGVFLMEGMWTRFFPAMVGLRDLIASGAIGEVRAVEADFGFRAGVDPTGRLFDPAMAGGGLLDVGVYCVSFASMLLGEPNRVTGLATMGEIGVDEQAAYVLGHPNGALAVLWSAIRTNSPQIAQIAGTEGSIAVPAPWWKPDRLVVSRGGSTEELWMPFESSGFNYEIAEAGRCIQAGEGESPVMPLDETIAILRTMDTLRRQWGLVYPME